MSFSASDLRFLIGRQLHELLASNGDYSFNPRSSKAALASRAAKLTVRECSLATMKGADLHSILIGMGAGSGNPRASKAALAARIVKALSKRCPVATVLPTPKAQGKRSRPASTASAAKTAKRAKRPDQPGPAAIGVPTRQGDSVSSQLAKPSSLKAWLSGSHNDTAAIAKGESFESPIAL